jgi:type I restriction enzyme S subunit
MNYEIVGIGEICDFVRGVTFDGNEVLSEKLDGYVPILRAGNISDTLEIQNDLVWVPSKRVSKEQYLQNYDIAICMASGSPAVLGKTAQVTQKFIGSVGAFCGIIRVKKADPSFIGYYFKSSAFMKWRDRQARGINIQNLRPTEVQEIQIPLPSLPEQQRIAAILQKADRLRRLRRYARQLSDGYLQSVFLEMFGNPVSNPKGWEIIESEKIISNIRYGTGSPPIYVEKGIPFIRATNVKNGTILTDGLVYISENEAIKIFKCKLNKGDLLLVRSGVNSGDCALIPSSYQGAYAAYDLIIEMAYPYNYYFNFIINSDYGKNIISTLSRRAGQPHINSDQVKSIPLPLPSKALIGEFAKLIQENEKLKAQQIESVRQTEMLFQSFLHQAFQGEL